MSATEAEEGTQMSWEKVHGFDISRRLLLSRVILVLRHWH